ncbi:MAG TPA: citramalate synthase [Gemmataceae bacterium]|jgi:2-isopropylmalate synthase
MAGLLPRIEAFDTTLRDGCQGESVKFALAHKLSIAEKLADLGFDFIEGGFPLANDTDREFFKRAKHLRLGRAQLVAFGMTRRRGIRADEDPSLLSLLAAETPVVSLVGKASAAQAREVLGLTDASENLRMIDESIRFLTKEGRRVFFDAEHCFDGYRSDQEYTLEVLEVARDAGADVLVLCDTNGGSLPEFVASIVAAVRAALGSVRLGIHTHNDGGLAIANALAAVAQGAIQVQGTVNGIGERCGNADLTAVLPNLALKLGREVLLPDSLAKLTELSRFVYDAARLRHRDDQPYVGNSAFAHKGGLHVAAIRKDPVHYEHVRPEVVGNARRVLVSDLSGRGNLIEKLDGFGVRYSTRDLDRVLAEVTRLEGLGWQFESADASLHLLALRLLGEHRPWFETQSYSVRSLGTADDSSAENDVEATVDLKVGGVLRQALRRGTGLVNALDRALRAALPPGDREMDRVRLKEYIIQTIPNAADSDSAEESSALSVRVTAQWQDDEGNVWKTVGVSRDLVAAIWSALVDAFEYAWLLEGQNEPAEPGRDLPQNREELGAVLT